MMIPIEVILIGISNDVNPEQLSKADSANDNDKL